MKHLIWGAVVACGLVSHAFGAETADQVKSQMTSGSAQVRAAAMEQFVRGFDLSSQPQQGTDALPIFISGMSDSDPTVRQFAATGLLKIASGTMRIMLPANPNLPDLTTSSQAQQALLTAMSDSDPIVRQAAMGAYSLTYKMTPDVDQKVIDTFNSYQPVTGQPDFRFALLGSLVNDRSPSEVATNFIVQKIDDPQFGVTALQSLAALKNPPADVLPKLLNELSQPTIPAARKAALIAAIKAYGPNAQAQLQQMLANDKNPQVQQALKTPIAPVPNPAQPPPPAPLPSPTSENITSPPSVPPPSVAPDTQSVAHPPAENGGGWVVPASILAVVLAAALILYRRVRSRKSE